jgi:carbonic anhydrase
LSQQLKNIIDANARYAAEFGEKKDLPVPPAKRIAVLTCMDARLDPAKYAGLSEGDAHVIRNAGGRASDDAIRSLVISYKLLGTREWFVIHHTECGMQTFTIEVMADLLASSLNTSTHDGTAWQDTPDGSGSIEGHYINWLTMGKQEKSLIEDITRIRNHPLVPGSIPIYGYIFDVKTGKLNEVPEASRAGKPLS